MQSAGKLVVICGGVNVAFVNQPICDHPEN